MCKDYLFSEVEEVSFPALEFPVFSGEIPEPVGMLECLIRFFGPARGNELYREVWN